MLGDLISEARGRRTGRRVVTGPSGAPRVEVSFEDSGKLLGMDGNMIGTYTSEVRPDGTIFGEGQGVIVTADGGMVSWKGMGTGVFRQGGAVGYRGSIHYFTASANLARLNSIAGVFEFEVDAEGNTHGKIWEWK
jgi:hypothetical protein